MSGVTTAFADVSTALLGDLVDVEGLAAIAKMHPDASEVHAPGMLVIAGGKRRKRVQKAGTSPRGLVQGFLQQKRRLAGTTPSPQVGEKAVDEKSVARGRAARADFDRFASTKTGKAVLIAGGAKATLHTLGGQKQDPYAYYGKADDEPGDIVWGGTFSKFDDDKKLAFGWASVVSLNGQPVIDRQGDVISVDEIENAAYVYVQKSRVAGEMHRRTADDQPHKVGELVESCVFTPEKCTAMGVSKEMAGRWWIGMKIDDEEAWQRVKKGEHTGWSIHGKGLRKSVTYDDLMLGRS